MKDVLREFYRKIGGTRLVIILLASVVVTQLFLMLLIARQPSELLPTLASAGVPKVDAKVKQKLGKLTFTQLIEGLTRLERYPEVIFDRSQAERLVPVMPLVRQVLVEGVGDKDAKTASHLAPMVRDYVENTLKDVQAERLVHIYAQGQLSATPQVVLERLPGLDKSLRQRIGMYDELSASSMSPVRSSLNQVNLLNLMLGMLMLEQVPDYKITPEQAKVMVPLLPALKQVCSRDVGAIGSAYEPVVEAQMRAVLTDDQKLKVLELVQANVIGKLDVNEESLFKKVEEFLLARVDGGGLVSYSNFLLAPREKSREGPAVIRSAGEMELQVLIRGIMFQLEKDKNLRLDKEQEEALNLIAPAIQQCLNNVIKGIKDLRIPELQGRVASILRDDQIQYIADHKLESMPELLPSKTGSDPLANELERFLMARYFSIEYKIATVDNSMLAAGGGERLASAMSKGGATGTGAGSAANQSAGGGTGDLGKVSTGGSGQDSGSYAPEHYDPVPATDVKKEPTPSSDSETSVHHDAVPGVKPVPTRNYTAPVPNNKPVPKRNYTAPVPNNKPVPKRNYTAPVPKQKQTIAKHKNIAPKPGKRVIKKTLIMDMPLEALVRGILITLERQPSLRVSKSQLARIAARLPEYKAALNVIDQNPGDRSAEVQMLSRELTSCLSPAQLKCIMQNDGKSRIGLYPADGESAWARELQRFVEAKSTGQQYKPLLNVGEGE